MRETRLGISGWRYAPWRGRFYPKDLPQKRELEYAARQLNSIEINGTFYSLRRPSSFATWYEQTPADFVFAVKCPRYITHMKRLREFADPLANFFASGVLTLGEKLGPLLWQFPPNFAYDHERFARFFEALPHDTAAAASVARKHSDFMKGRTRIPRSPPRPLRHAIEIRHASFLTDSFIRLLRAHSVALVIADTAGLHRFAEDITADFVYIRLHGHEEIYASGYDENALRWWARRIRTWRSGGEPPDATKATALRPPRAKSRDVYVYFDNDKKVLAPPNALTLAEMLSAPVR